MRKKRRDVTASPEVSCSQVHDVHPLLCRDVQLFHFQHHADGKKSAGERERQLVERDTEIHTTSVTSAKHQERGKREGKDREMDRTSERERQIGTESRQKCQNGVTREKEGGKQRRAERERPTGMQREKPL